MFDQVDELLLETEEPSFVKKIPAQKQQQQHKKTDSLVLSLSGSLDFDSYDVDDEPLKGALNKDLSVINGQNAESESNNGSIITDSLDLDNSDDLNKIIQKYETMLNGKQQQQSTPLVVMRTIDDSWNAKAKNTTISSNKTHDDIEDEYSDDDDFIADGKDIHHDEDDKIVDEEIYMNSSIGQKDSQFLNEIMNQPLRNKNQDIKSAAAKVIAQLEGSGEYQDDIDEFIRRHIENEEKEESKVKIQDQMKQEISQSTSYSSSSSSNSSTDEVFEEDKRTPKQILLDDLKKLADIFGKYSLNERELFLNDVDSIMKILSYNETLEYILPILDIYANEQEFLKLQFFQKLPQILSKLLKSTVQTEGVDGLIKLSKDGLDKSIVQELVSNLVELLMSKADQSEAAKIAVLMIVERFADEDILVQADYDRFLQEYLSKIQKGMLFKIKKFLVPTLLAISKHINYERFIEIVYNIFIKFSTDDIWGVRKVCIEKLQDFVKLIKPSDFQMVAQSIKILEQSLYDQSRWVKNQAFQNFGYIINEISDKSKAQSLDPLIKQNYKILIQNAWDSFYNPLFVSTNEDDQSICQSFMGNQNDDVDKIKYTWAFFLPCALVLNGGEQYWHQTLKSLYEKLYKDILLTVRKTLAASITDVAKLLDLSCPETQEFMMKVINHYLQDIDEIKAKVTPQLCSILSLFPAAQHSYLLSTLIMEQIGSMQIGRQTRDSKIALLEQIYNLFSPQTLAELEFHHHLIQIIEEDPAVQHKQRACYLMSKQVIVPLIKSKKYRKELTAFLDKQRASSNFRQRQLYVNLAQQSHNIDKEIFKKHFAKSLCNDMIYEKVKVVQITLSQLCADVEVGYSKSLDKVRSVLQQQSYLQQYLKPLQSTKHLLHYQDEDVGEYKDDTKEQEQFEKTVNIRFANYSMLAKSGTLGAGQSEINSTLLALLGGMLGFEKGEEAMLKSNGNSQWQN